MPAAPSRAILSTRVAHGRGARPSAGATPAGARHRLKEKRGLTRVHPPLPQLFVRRIRHVAAREEPVLPHAAPPSAAGDARPASHAAASREAGHSRPLCALQKMAPPRTPVDKSSSSVVATPAPPPQFSYAVDAQLASLTKLLLPARHRHARRRHRGFVHNHGWNHANLSWRAYPEWPQRDSNPRPSVCMSGAPPLPT